MCIAYILHKKTCFSISMYNCINIKLNCSHLNVAIKHWSNNVEKILFEKKIDSHEVIYRLNMVRVGGVLLFKNRLCYIYRRRLRMV
jgi:hypothetical protein